MAGRKQPWDRQRGEPQNAYVRFLIYRNLGPGRTLATAYAAYLVGQGVTERNGSQQASGQWAEDSARWDWPHRAASWDISSLADAGREVVAAYIAVLAQWAAGLLQTDLKPETYAEWLEGAKTLSEYVPQEASRRPVADERPPGPIGPAPRPRVAG